MKYRLGEKHPIKPSLYQVIYLRDIPRYDVKAGDKGGWISNYRNLSQEGDCVVLGDAWVEENAQVYGDAKVYGNVSVSGNAQVYDNAMVYSNAKVFNQSKIFGNARIYDNARTFSNSKVFGEATVFSPNRREHIYLEEDVEVSRGAIHFSVRKGTRITSLLRWLYYRSNYENKTEF